MSDYKRAFDTSFEAHQGLLHRFAKRGYGRLLAAGVCIDYDDVFQVMSISYIHAQRKYDPQRGISFSAYLGKAIWNDFNRFAEIEINRALQESSIESMSDTNEDGDSLYEVIDGEYATPEQYAEVKQEWKENFAKCNSVSRLLIKQVLNPDEGVIELLKEKQRLAALNRETGEGARTNPSREVSVGLIAEYFDIGKLELRAAKKNINSVYGTIF